MSWTRDRADADIHVLVTALETGGGGLQYTLQFIGQRKCASHADTLVTSVSAVASAGTSTVIDPWNLWVYRVSTNGFFNGESQSSSSNLSGNLSATRTTAEWKISIGANANYRQSNYTFNDTTPPSVFIQRSSGANVTVVKSITDHWSAGVSANVGHAEFNNQALTAGGRASIEYNFYKWKEATQHQFIIANTTKERWGSVDLSASVSQYLHDQIFLARGGLGVEDILTRQRQLATSFSYFTFVGLSYTFGSIYNTIVNPRLDKVGGGGMSFMFSM